MKLFLWLLLLLPALTYAQNREETAVAAAVERLRQATIEPNAAKLAALTSASLTYGHSNGLVEDQKTFIHALVSGEWNFTDIRLSNQTLRIEGNTAWVRHTLKGDTHNKGKDPAKVTLSVLLVYIKVKGEWILLARQAVKIA